MTGRFPLSTRLVAPAATALVAGALGATLLRRE